MYIHTLSFSFHKICKLIGVSIAPESVHTVQQGHKISSVSSYHHSPNSGKGNLMFEIRGLFACLQLNNW